MATLFVDKRTGRFGIRYQAPNRKKDGRRMQKVRMLGTSDRKLAKKLFDEFRREYETDEARRRLGLGGEPDLSLAELWERYEGGSRQKKLKPSTLSAYKVSFHRLIDYVALATGGDLVSSLSPGLIDAFAGRRIDEAMGAAQGSTGAAAATDLRHIRTVLNWGAKATLCAEGLCGMLEDLAPRATAPDLLSDDELTALFDAADQVDRENGPDNRRMGLMVRMAYYHALRPEEVRSIQTYWIDEKEQILHIRQDDKVGFVPKGHRPRDIRLYPETMRLAKEQGGYKGSSWLFGYGPTSTLRGSAAQAFRRDWDRVRKLAKLGYNRPGGKPPLTFKQMRKNGALQYMLHTGSEAITRAVMGHSSDTQTLLNHYVDSGGYMTKSPSELWDREWVASLKAA